MRTFQPRLHRMAGVDGISRGRPQEELALVVQPNLGGHQAELAVQQEATGHYPPLAVRVCVCVCVFQYLPCVLNFICIVSNRAFFYSTVNEK